MENRKQTKILVSILTYNCEPKVEQLLNKYEKFKEEKISFKKLNILTDVVFFDDCSYDDTIKLISQKVNSNIILKSDINLGYGGNVKRAIEYASLKNYEYIAIFPGDMQRSFSDLSEMIKIICNESFDVVVGKKSKIINKQKMPADRKAGNIFLSFMSKIWNDKTLDPLSGFKIYKISTCKSIFWLCQNRFGFDLDFSFWASIKDLKINSYDATVTYEKHISSMPSTFYQGLTLVFRLFLLGFLLQPIIKILKKSTKTINK